MKRRSLLIATAIIPVASVIRPAGAFVLVTPDEVAASQQGTPPPMTRSVGNPDAPSIEVVRPDAAQPLRGPLTIQLRFVAKGGTQINPQSFRARYGFLGLDITQRLLQRARLELTGLAVENADIPAGEHSIRLEIADTMGRVGARTFRFTVHSA